MVFFLLSFSNKLSLAYIILPYFSRGLMFNQRNLLKFERPNTIDIKLSLRVQGILHFINIIYVIFLVNVKLITYSLMPKT